MTRPSWLAVLPVMNGLLIIYWEKPMIWPKQQSGQRIFVEFRR